MEIEKRKRLFFPKKILFTETNKNVGDPLVSFVYVMLSPGVWWLRVKHSMCHLQQNCFEFFKARRQTKSPSRPGCWALLLCPTVPP